MDGNYASEKSYYDKLSQLYNDYFKQLIDYIDDLLLKKDISQFSNKEFVDYLHHPNKNALMVKLHELLDNERGKTVAIVIQSLKNLRFISGYKSNAVLFNSMRKVFGDIGTNSGINNFLSYDGTKLDKSDIATTTIIIESIK